MFTCLVLKAVLAATDPAYLVLVERGGDGAYLPAAGALAAQHGGRVVEFDSDDSGALLTLLREHSPRYVAFVLPPQRIDVQLAHRFLEVSTQVDEDPFVDFEYGFITGRDGEAALRFVERIIAAWKREYGLRCGFFGSWEGPVVPTIKGSGGAARALGLDISAHLLGVKESDEVRAEKARAAMADFAGRDVLLFFSHGYPDRMVACFDAANLRDWNVDLGGAILFNCSCYNGAPGRWWEIGPGGAYLDRGLTRAEDSVALAIIDAGVAGYFAGIDPWHGPLANQVFLLAVDDGLSLGGAAKRMYDRLALAFLPERVHYEPMSERRFAGEGRGNRLGNGAGMIYYGDPALAPFSRKAAKLLSAGTEVIDEHSLRCTIDMKPMLEGAMNAADGMLPQARLMDYYSVRTSDLLAELKMEVHRVVPLPEGWTVVSGASVESLVSGGRDVPAGEVEWAIEQTHDGPMLHLRVPIDARMFGTTWQMIIAQRGLTARVRITRA